VLQIEGIAEWGSPRPLVAYLADSSKLSEKDHKALQSIAEKIGQWTEG
jgi:hypothetical protein